MTLAKKLSAFSVLLGWTVLAHGELGLNMTPGVTPVSQEVYQLHMIILWICIAIGVVVFGAMFYSIYYHRKSKGAKPAQFHESTTAEIAWTVVPVIILVVMAYPATKALIMMEDTGAPDLTVKVTGYQWKWGYEYLSGDEGMENGLQFFSTLSTPRAQVLNEEAKGENYLLEVDNPLVLPVGKKIRILTTSADVIHAWWVPALGWKRDAIPGFINESWTYIEKPGVYRGQCAELCGRDHGFMPIVIHAMLEADYKTWVSEQTQSKQISQAMPVAHQSQTLLVANQNPAKSEPSENDEEPESWDKTKLMSHGKQVYQQYCVACHQSNGQGMPPAFPSLVTSNVVSGPVTDHIDIILNGRPGTAMQAFANQLTDSDIASVITYQRNSWGHNDGVIEPAAVAQVRQ